MNLLVHNIDHFNRKCETLARIDLSDKIIAVDFDGTCVTHDFPAVGTDVPGAAEVLKALDTAGAKLILWTMRSDQEEITNDPHANERVSEPERFDTVKYLMAAIEWFDDREIKLYGINANTQQAEWTSSPKAYAHVYIDDAALGCPLIAGLHARPFIDWNKVCSLLIARFL